MIGLESWEPRADVRQAKVQHCRGGNTDLPQLPGAITPHPYILPGRFRDMKINEQELVSSLPELLVEFERTKKKSLKKEGCCPTTCG